MGGQWWSWVLTAVGLTGWWLTGRRLWAGWAVSLGVQVLWLAYAVTSRQWGFVVAALAYGTMAGINLRRWRREARARAEPPV